MGKTSKWLRSILTGKKDRDKHKDKDKSSKTTNPISSNDTEDRTAPISTTTPKEKRRWSFRRSSASSTATASPAESNVVSVTTNSQADAENEQKKKQAMAVAAAADAAVAAAQAAAAVIRLTAAGSARSVEEAAVIKIQSVFRSYLARKALCALRGLVKLQALVRGHLVRKQATATLRCMQALVTAQARARAQRIRMASEEKTNQRQSTHRKATEDNLRHIYDEMDMNLEENIKIVEMDVCETKGDSRRRRTINTHHPHPHPHPHHTYYSPNATYSKEEAHRAISSSPSALTDMSPRAYSGHFEDSTPFSTAQSSPYYYSAISRPDDSKNLPSAFPKPPYAESVMSYDYPLFPNYMANTESSRAKARSQSAPKQRPAESFERQPSRRRPSVEGRNVPRPVRMQRSASHVGASAQNYQYPWSIKLDKSSASLKDSECGSTSTMLTNTNYCRSLVAYNPREERYY